MATEEYQVGYEAGYQDGWNAAQQPPKLEDIEQHRMQMAGISVAAIGYWKEGDSIHPDYDTPALRDVAKLYAKYDALYKAQQPQAEAVPPDVVRDAERYRFIRDADRSHGLENELTLYAMESLDEYVDAAMEDEARNKAQGAKP